jgi:Rrf2 family cysteine metabolism transcriptional repressor
LHSSQQPVRLSEIARRQHVSLSYLEHIVGPLVAGGVLRSTRGVNGGLSLRRTPSDIELGEVLNLLEDDLVAGDCVRNPDTCARSGSCATRDLWVELTEAMNAVLASRTLADLLSSDGGGGVTRCAPDAVRPMLRPLFGAASPATSGTGHVA